MKIYQNHYRNPCGESTGYSYHTNKLEAHRLAARKQAEGVEVSTDCRDIPISKRGMIRALTYFGSHPDNG